MLSSLRSFAAHRALRPTQAVVASDMLDLTKASGMQARGMAINLAALKNRIKATANVAKLTGVMKLVASSKLRGVEEVLEQGRLFGESLIASVGRDEPTLSTEEKQINRLVVLLTTDRGLCGSVNSSLIRMARGDYDKYTEAGDNVKLFVFGEKGRANLSRDIPEAMVASIDSCFDKDPLFELASGLTERIVSHEFDEITFYFNKFESAAKFHNTCIHIPQVSGLGVGNVPDKFKGWEIEPANNEETLVNLMEYGLAGVFFYAMMESQACEVSQRVTAMDNASTNANDMVDRFTLIYNRARQAKITTELTEIISGAESIKEESTD